jgi:hypothetical protein
MSPILPNVGTAFGGGIVLEKCGLSGMEHSFLIFFLRV